MGEWSLVRRYFLLMFIAFPISDESGGTGIFMTGTAAISVRVKAVSFALRAFATSFARVTSFLKNSPIMVIMKRQ